MARHTTAISYLKDGTVEEAQSKSEIAALITEKIRLEESK